MSIDPTDPRPPYRQIADQLRADIYGQALAPGDQLPSERELVERYGTAHQTVRQAISLLKAEGLVIGRPGRGVFVRERPLLHRLDANRRFITQARSQGLSAEARLLEVRFTPAPPPVAALLDLPEDAQVLVRRYLMLVGGEPVQLADSYFPAELAEGSIIGHQDNITPGRIDADLKERFGLEPARLLDELTVRMPTAKEIRSLRLPPGTPVASLLRTYRDPTGKPFEVAHFVLAGDKHILIYEGQPSTSA